MGLPAVSRKGDGLIQKSNEHNLANQHPTMHFCKISFNDHERSVSSMSGIINPGVAPPRGSVGFATIVREIVYSPSHNSRPGRNRTLIQRNPNFFGCGSVCHVSA